MSKCGNFLRWLSFGKYNTKLYFGSKEEDYSTITGGIFTLLFAFAVVGASINIFYETINWQNYTITTTYSDLSLYNETVKVKDLKSVLSGMRF